MLDSKVTCHLISLVYILVEHFFGLGSLFFKINGFFGRLLKQVIIKDLAEILHHAIW